MAKKPENVDNFEFQTRFNIKDVEKSANIDIKPKLEITELGIENAKTIEIASVIYEVDIPAEKSIDGSGKMEVIDVYHEGVLHQLVANAKSFQFQLDVLRYKLKFATEEDLIGFKLKIWKEEKYINTPVFKGNAKVYCITPAM